MLVKHLTHKDIAKGDSGKHEIFVLVCSSVLFRIYLCTSRWCTSTQQASHHMHTMVCKKTNMGCKYARANACARICTRMCVVSIHICRVCAYFRCIRVQSTSSTLILVYMCRCTEYVIARQCIPCAIQYVGVGRRCWRWVCERGCMLTVAKIWRLWRFESTSHFLS